MKGTAIVIPVDGSPWQIEELTDTPPLEWLQKRVGGYIEVVPYFDKFVHQDEPRRCIAFCNEEGKLMGQPVNDIATVLWAAQNQPQKLNDVLVGPVVVLFGDAEFMEEL